MAEYHSIKAKKAFPPFRRACTGLDKTPRSNHLRAQICVEDHSRMLDEMKRDAETENEIFFPDADEMGKNSKTKKTRGVPDASEAGRGSETETRLFLTPVKRERTRRRKTQARL